MVLLEGGRHVKRWSPVEGSRLPGLYFEECILSHTPVLLGPFQSDPFLSDSALSGPSAGWFASWPHEVSNHELPQESQLCGSQGPQTM